MNRRGFLQMMVGGVAAAAAVRTFPFRVFSFPTTPEPMNATIAEYADFVTISDLMGKNAIDPVIAKVAEECGYRAGLTLNTMIAMAHEVKPNKDGNYFGFVHPRYLEATA